MDKYNIEDKELMENYIDIQILGKPVGEEELAVIKPLLDLDDEFKEKMREKYNIEAEIIQLHMQMLDNKEKMDALKKEMKEGKKVLVILFLLSSLREAMGQTQRSWMLYMTKKTGNWFRTRSLRFVSL